MSGLDALTVFSVMSGAISTVFGLWIALVRSRMKQLEEDNVALDKFNKRLVAMIVAAAGDSDKSLTDMRVELARMLRDG